MLRLSIGMWNLRESARLMQKKIVYSQLKTFLFQLEFTLLPVQENHLVFQHPESEALIVLPHYEPNDAIARVHWILIYRILIQ